MSSSHVDDLHTQTQTHTHTHTHTCTQAHTHTHTSTRTHAHMHIHTKKARKSVKTAEAATSASASKWLWQKGVPLLNTVTLFNGHDQILQHSATLFNAFYHVATRCNLNALQHTQCNTLRHILYFEESKQSIPFSSQPILRKQSTKNCLLIFDTQQSVPVDFWYATIRHVHTRTQSHTRYTRYPSTEIQTCLCTCLNHT